MDTINSRQWLVRASDRGPVEFASSSITSPASSNTRTILCDINTQMNSKKYKKKQWLRREGEVDHLLDEVEALERGILALRHHLLLLLLLGMTFWSRTKNWETWWDVCFISSSREHKSQSKVCEEPDHEALFIVQWKTLYFEKKTIN